MDHQQRRPLAVLRHLGRQTTAMHRRQRAGCRAGTAGRHPGMHRHRTKALRITHRQQGRHARPGRQPGHRHRVAVDRIQQAGLVDGGHQRGGLGVGVVVAGVVPVPAPLRVVGHVLLGVEHQEALARGEPVHARAAREHRRGLATAMQHHHQRQALMVAHTHRAEQEVAAQPPRPHRLAGDPVATAGRRPVLRRHRVDRARHRLARRLGAGLEGAARHRRRCALHRSGKRRLADAWTHWGALSGRESG